MQETKYLDGLEEKLQQEIFISKAGKQTDPQKIEAIEKQMIEAMDARLSELEDQGHKLVRRVELPSRQVVRLAKRQAAKGDYRLLRKITGL